MKKKLLGLGFVVFDLLVVMYYVRMTYGWQEVLRIASATGQALGFLFLILLGIAGFVLLIDDDGYSNGEF